ncbi:MAG: tRNA uridine-5-carboxymethylaminomethyl(34) synthesis GTPase MnmE [Tannerella sp.]|jgi:tRNA modification GTPase|nr:tRNA uridine-5-carboxymethylaminomethyl(34) synthesis GTPase MnmE [Tannerella sp.]
MYNNDTICAVSTPPGTGGIAVIRVSGSEAFSVCNKLLAPRNGTEQNNLELPSKPILRTIYLNDKPLDQVLISVFHAPHSYTGEDTVEISCHGSLYIQQQIMQTLIECGARQATAGEFTQRAFLNGKMDLSQAEAVADLIASTSEGMHRLAINQMRGGFSDELQSLREQLLHFVSLIELELDFSDHDDIEFVDRSELRALAIKLRDRIHTLADSFSAGNAIKNGIPVAIIGKTNVGKSTLLNGLLNEDRAIVSDIPGTTRDTIEETLYINGQLFRFIDTAGLRDNAADSVEALGIRRSFEKAEKASVILYLFDLTQEDNEDTVNISRWLHRYNKPVLMLGTKNDIARRSPIHTAGNVKAIHISCLDKSDIERVKQYIVSIANVGKVSENDVIVSNIRHYEALCRAGEAIDRVLAGLDEIPTDLLAEDIRDCLRHLAEITGGEITTNEVLANIFSKFCIGK